MAMVSCRECGNEVSDAAPTCPRGGIASPGGVTMLEVRRVSRLSGAIVPMSVWVDSQHVGTLTSGKSVTVTVSPGIHRVECSMQHSMAKDAPGQEFTVPAGRRLVVLVAPSRLNGKPSFSSELA